MTTSHPLLLVLDVVIIVLLKATLIIALVWGATKVLHRASAALHRAMWSMALVTLLSLPALAVWGPAWTIPLWLAPADLEEAVEAQTRAMSGSAGSLRASPHALSPIQPKEQQVRQAEEGAFAASDTGKGTLPFWVWQVLLGVWAIGGVLLLWHLLYDLIRVWRISRRAQASPRWKPAQLAQTLAHEMGIRRPVRVRRSRAVTMPMTWGLWRPTILLPTVAEQWSQERLQVVLVHELAHIKNRDFASHLMAQIVTACYWFNPLVWKAHRYLRMAQEKASDDQVLHAGMPRATYAAHLVAIARGYQKTVLPAAMSMAYMPTLKQRVRAILDGQVNRHPVTVQANAMITLLSLGIALPLASIALWDIEALPPGQVAISSPRANAVYMYFEAEQGMLGQPMQVGRHAYASDSAFVWVPEGPGNDAPAGGQGFVEYAFDVPSAGDYVVWGRTLTPNIRDNSFYVSLNGKQEAWWELPRPYTKPEKERWSWDPVSSRDPETRVLANPVLFKMKQGRNTLRLRVREDGTRLDGLLITNDLSFKPRGRQPLMPPIRPVYLWVEAEQGHIATPLQRKPIDNEDNNLHIEVEPGHYSRDEPPQDGHAVYAVDVPERGDYVLWGRVLATDDHNDSFWVCVNEGPWYSWNGLNRSIGWQWDRLHDMDGDGKKKPVYLKLEAGHNAIAIAYREAETKLDGLLVTNDLTYRPNTQLPFPPPMNPEYIWIEGETGEIQRPMERGVDLKASSTGFVQVGKGYQSLDTPPEQGHISYRFTAEEGGIYILWGRVFTPDIMADSFWVRFDGGDWVRWREIALSDAWHWAPVHDWDRNKQIVRFNLPKGRHTLEIAYREDGAQLDRFLLTNDPTYRPEGIGAVRDQAMAH